MFYRPKIVLLCNCFAFYSQIGYQLLPLSIRCVCISFWSTWNHRRARLSISFFFSLFRKLSVSYTCASPIQCAVWRHYEKENPMPYASRTLHNNNKIETEPTTATTEPTRERYIRNFPINLVQLSTGLIVSQRFSASKRADKKNYWHTQYLMCAPFLDLSICLVVYGSSHMTRRRTHIACRNLLHHIASYRNSKHTHAYVLTWTLSIAFTLLFTTIPCEKLYNQRISL